MIASLLWVAICAAPGTEPLLRTAAKDVDGLRDNPGTSTSTPHRPSAQGRGTLFASAPNIAPTDEYGATVDCACVEEIRRDGTCRMPPHLKDSHLHLGTPSCYTHQALTALMDVIQRPSKPHEDKHDVLACFMSDVRMVARDESLSAADILRTLGNDNSFEYDYSTDPEWQAIVADNQKLAKAPSSRELHSYHNPHVQRVDAAVRALASSDCAGDIIMFVADIFALFMSFLGLAGLGRQMGEVMGNLLGPVGRTVIRNMMMALRLSDGTIPNLISGIPKFVKAIVSNTKMTVSALSKSITEQMHWYDVVTSAASFIVSITAFFVSGGASFALTLASASLAIYSMERDGEKIVKNCINDDAAAMAVDVGAVIGANKVAAGDSCNQDSECQNQKCGKVADYRKSFCCPFGYDTFGPFGDDHYCLGLQIYAPCEHDFQCEYGCETNDEGRYWCAAA